MFVAPLLLAALVQQPTILPPPAPALPAVARDTSPFRRLELPTPNFLREGSGRPGPRYWQQRADYTINVALDTTTHTVAGGGNTPHTHQSPHPLTSPLVRARPHPHPTHHPPRLTTPPPP